MGEAKQKKSATARLIAQYPICALCGERASTTRDHVPPISLFDNSLRPDKLVIPACDTCNRGTSTSDLIVVIISRWNYYSDHQERKDHPRLVARLRKQCPEVIQEWIRLDNDGRERARAHLIKQGVNVPPDAGLSSIGEITIRHLNLFSYKFGLAIYFEHFKKPLSANGAITAIWRTKEDFRNLGVPKELLDLLPRYATLQQGNWQTTKDFEYRFDLNSQEGLLGCVARFRSSLFITAFAVEDYEVLPPESRTPDWIRSAELLTILQRPEFRRRLQ